jgi:hypothetical protein
VHGEQLVVLRVGDELQAGLGQLGTNDQRHDAADEEEHERRDQVQVADDLVIGSGQPRHKHRSRTARH